jgi:hypothetical protein
LLRNYPKKSSVRKVMENHLSGKDSKEFLKRRGILVHSLKKSDVATIGGDYYFNQSDYSELKRKMDVDDNFKKLGTVAFPKEHLGNFESTILSLNNEIINTEDNTRVIISKSSNGGTKISLTYDEYKPSMIDLLDKTRREVEININSHSKSKTCSLDFSVQSPNDYKKVKELLELIGSVDEDLDYDFEEISLGKLTKVQRIQLFEEFFKRIKAPWELAEIKKLKVKRDSQEKKVSEDQLEGINSAVLDGENLRENRFVKSTVEQGFYFSMASMRLDQKSTVNFIDLVIDFKTRPEMCEVKITNSGIYVTKESLKLKEVKSVLDSVQQDILLLEFKNLLYEIYLELTKIDLPNIELLVSKEVAAAEEDTNQF